MCAAEEAKWALIASPTTYLGAIAQCKKQQELCGARMWGTQMSEMLVPGEQDTWSLSSHLRLQDC